MTMKILSHHDLFDLAAKITTNNERLMNALNNEVPACAHTYEDLLGPWRNYLNELMPQYMEWAFACVKRLYTYDCTREQLVEAMRVIVDKLNETANALVIDECLKGIQEAFNATHSPVEAVTLAAEIDKMKNACLAEVFK